MNKELPSERGQILVLLVLALMGLLGFTALAIDGGMIYADRRYMQSAADASSLAGASMAAQYIEDHGYKTLDFNCSLSVVPGMLADAEATAQLKAQGNGFIDIPIDDTVGTVGGPDYGINATCNFGTNKVEVLVMISKETDTSFVQLFTSAPTRNTVRSISEAEPGFTAGSGAAIISTSFDCATNKGGVKFDGTPKTIINAGGIYSNSCTVFKGSTYVDVKDGDINYYEDSYWLKTGACPDPDKCMVSPEPTPVSEYHPITFATIEPPVCEDSTSDPTVKNISVSTGDDTTIDPGYYGSIRMTGKGKLTLNPGLYCVSEEITVGDGEMSGEGITIYYTNTEPKSGDGIFITGGLIKLVAQNETPAPPVTSGGPGSVEDMLIYLGKDSDARIELKGNGGSYFAGTVYAPSSNIFIGGTPDLVDADKEVVFKTSIIGYDVTVGGTASLSITYEKDMDYSVPASMQLIK